MLSTCTTRSKRHLSASSTIYTTPHSLTLLGKFPSIISIFTSPCSCLQVTGWAHAHNLLFRRFLLYSLLPPRRTRLSLHWTGSHNEKSRTSSYSTRKAHHSNLLPPIHPRSNSHQHPTPSLPSKTSNNYYSHRPCLPCLYLRRSILNQRTPPYQSLPKHERKLNRNRILDPTGRSNPSRTKRADASNTTNGGSTERSGDTFRSRTRQRATLDTT